MFQMMSWNQNYTLMLDLYEPHHSFIGVTSTLTIGGVNTTSLKYGDELV